MFRFFSRVVVVSVFALSMNIAMVPAAQARMQVGKKVVSNRDNGCVEQAMEWLNRILGKQRSQKDLKKATANDGGASANGGGCIDPLGNPRPCP